VSPPFSPLQHHEYSVSFGRDYGANELLDRYSDSGLNDDEDIEALPADARRAAERKMAARDRREMAGKRGQRAARRSRAPAFFGEEDMDDEMEDDDGLSRMKQRTRRQYDERRDIDDMDGLEDVRSHIHSARDSLLTNCTGNSA